MRIKTAFQARRAECINGYDTMLHLRQLLAFRLSDRCTLIVIHIFFQLKKKFYHLWFTAGDFAGSAPPLSVYFSRG